MAVTIKTYAVLYSEGNEPDLTEVNNQAAEGWELVQFLAVAASGGRQARFAYIMQRSAGQTETDVLIGNINVSVSDNRFTLTVHNLSNGDLVRFDTGEDDLNVLPAPLVEGVYYFVVGARLNDFQVSLIAGGNVVDITDQGVGTTNEVWRK